MWVMVEPCSRAFLDFLIQCVEEEHKVTLIENDRCYISGAEDEVVIFHGRLPKRIDSKGCVYLAMKKRLPSQLKGDVAVVCPDHDVLTGAGMAYYPCGFSGISCLTVSSKTEDSVVISLLREIRSLYGRRIEPFELPVESRENLSDTQLLMAYMVKLLLYPEQ